MHFVVDLRKSPIIPLSDLWEALISLAEPRSDEKLVKFHGLVDYLEGSGHDE